ncbi:hypothetical protein HGT70_07175 [Rosenbergiella collisarenosi]|uniref:hypothetical protein n=1 Tax=Rosenbergiella collisarenosi TaxID=1544695 RepID=UPI001BD94D50|nr:hypothetical protein [Rosenbergiella collisarenosi]MBT0721063.1 hypothetical protein [Rosenbergiella collisarenosi]
MALNQKFKAVITFGGNLDSSWKRSTQGINKGIKDVEKQTQKLTKQQQTLSAEIKKGKLAGKNISSLKRDYSTVTQEIKKTTQAQEALNRKLKRAEQFKHIQGLGKGLFSRASRMAGAPIPSGLALGGGSLIASALGTLITPAIRNAKTAERAGVAQRYGVDVETFNAWDTIGRDYGLNGESFGSMFEEYLQKAGQYKQTGKQRGLEEAFKALGFKAGDLAGLKDMDQFNKIIERALTLEDPMVASFALDKLLSGEASKILMLLKQSGKSYRDVMEEQKRYQMVTEAGTRGAQEGQQAISNLQTVMSSALDEISGQLGDQLSPKIRALTDDLADWFRNGGINKIVHFMKNEMYPSVLKFGSGVLLVGKVLYAAAKKLSWLLPDDKGNKKRLLQAVATGTPLKIAEIQAREAGLGDWFAQRINSPKVVDSLTNQWTRAEEKAGWRVTRNPFKNGEFQESTSQLLLESIDGKSKSEPLPLGWLSEPSLIQPELSPAPFPTHHDKTAITEDNRQGGDNDASSVERASWAILMQHITQAEGAPKTTEITDRRKQELKIEINVSDEKTGVSIADEVVNRVNAADIFNGNNAMYDKGELW